MKNETTLTRSISINAVTDDVFSFVNDSVTLPDWLIQCWLHAFQNDVKYWRTLMRRSYGRSMITKSARACILRQDYVDIGGRTWKVQATVLPQKSGSLFILKITKPDVTSEDVVKRAVKMIDMKLVMTKVRMESTKELAQYASN